ncbi:MAG: hydroxyacid dehydrogenase, partial [Candidatus Omnitrophica bacterium]|nr:hydroxyacid dehydrogenase [Candidatus Omnitrophota bacterium]MBU1997535.1 hydroxyacid dehydrogenase [Candidatus Omnitrophota bacterium]
MEKKKVFISTSTFAKFSDEPLRILEGSGFEHILNPTGRKVTEDELAKLAEGCVGLVAGTEKISGEVMDKLCDLKVISRCGVGMDSVDLEAAKKKGIEVVNTPDAPTLAVAELTIGLILNLLRKISSMDKELKYGVWNKKMGNLLLNKKVGIVGFGRIGRKVAEMLMQFGCAIAYHDSFVENNDMGAEKMMLNDLMKWADIISI